MYSAFADQLGVRPNSIPPPAVGPLAVLVVPMIGVGLTPKKSKGLFAGLNAVSILTSPTAQPSRPVTDPSQWSSSWQVKKNPFGQEIAPLALLPPKSPSMPSTAPPSW